MFLKNQFGFTLTEVLLVVGVSSFLIFGGSQLILDSQKTEREVQSQFWLQEQQIQIQKAMASETNWFAIKSANPSMSCFDSATSCLDYKDEQSLKLPINGQLIDGSLPNLGLDSNAHFCNAFNPVEGNKNCPYGLKLTWKAICNDGLCKNAQPKLEARFAHKDSSAKKALNLNSYNIVVYKDARMQNMNDICVGMGGTFDGTNCNLNSTNQSCDPSNTLGLGATFLLGFDLTGKPICGKPTLSPCSSNEVVIGFDSNGATVCGPKCVSGPGVVNCQGYWDNCVGACGTTGTQTYVVSTPAQNGGAACEANSGQSRSCQMPACGGSPINCVGSWGSCGGASCGQVGSQIYSVTTVEQNGGTACSASHGQTQSCTMPGCAPQDCIGSWGSCNSSTGLETYIISQQQIAPGLACPFSNGATRPCDVDCVGSWSACSGTPSQRVYSISIFKQNNGLACPATHGQIDDSGYCNTQPQVCNQLAWCHLGIVTTCKRFFGGTHIEESSSAPYNPVTGLFECGLGGTPPEGSHIGKSCPNSVPTCSGSPTCQPERGYCFVAGTKVRMADGSMKSIELIKAGEKVLSFDEITQTQRVDTVAAPIHHQKKNHNLYQFKLSNGKILTSTEYHPFFVIEKNNYFEARQIKTFLDHHQPVSFLGEDKKQIKILSLNIETKKVPVYNIEVQGLANYDSHYKKYGRGHNYYAEGILTHNKAIYENACPSGMFELSNNQPYNNDVFCVSCPDPGYPEFIKTPNSSPARYRCCSTGI